MIQVFTTSSEVEQIFQILFDFVKVQPFVLDLSLSFAPVLLYPHAAHLPYNYGVFFPCVQQSGKGWM